MHKNPQILAASISALALLLVSSSASALQLSLDANWSDSGIFPVLADLDNDGSDEIIATDNYMLYLYAWKGNGSMLDGWPVLLSNSISNPLAADINNDGEKEVVFGDYMGILSVYSRNGTLAWQDDSCYLESGSIDSSPVLADIDGDGAIDIMFSCTKFFASSLYALDNSGNPVLGWEAAKTAAGATVGSPTVSDLDGDGTKDAVINGWFGSPPFFVQVFYGNGSDAIIYSDVDSSRQPGGPPAVSDLDGDGKKEIVITSRNDTQADIYIIENDGTASSLGLPAAGYPSPIALEDLDNDSSQEIMVIWDDGSNRKLYVWDAGLSEEWSYPFGSGPSYFLDLISPMANDINDDGVPEVIAPAGEDLFILSNSGSLLWSQGYGYGFSISTPAVGDVNGDGQKEVVIGTDDGFAHYAMHVYATGNGYCLHIKSMDVLNSTFFHDITIPVGTMYNIEMRTWNSCNNAVKTMQIIQALKGITPVNMGTIRTTIKPGETSVITIGFILPSVAPGTLFTAQGFNWNHWIDQTPGTFNILSHSNQVQFFSE